MNIRKLKLKFLGQMIPVINITNGITPQTTEKISQTLKKLDRDRTVALAVTISCQCGLPVQAQIIANKLLNFTSSNNIKLYTFAGDRTTASGYYLLSAGNHVFADRSSLIGNVSMSFMKYQMEGLLEKSQISRVNIATQEKLMKNMMSPWSSLKEEDQKYLKELCEDSHQKIVGDIRKHRGNKLKGTDQELFNGDIFTGEQAAENGMVDEIGTMTEVLGKKFPEAKLVVQMDRSFLQNLIDA